MEVDHNGFISDEIFHRPVDEDCHKMTIDETCDDCPMLIECYETNGYQMPSDSLADAGMTQQEIIGG